MIKYLLVNISLERTRQNWGQTQNLLLHNFSYMLYDIHLGLRSDLYCQ